MVLAMAFREDEDALRNRVDSLEDELARSRAEADRLREERDRALAAPPTAQFGAGQLVWIEWGGRWWRGSVLHAVGPDLYRVHYTGWSSRWDETVPAARVAQGEGPAPGPVARGAPPVRWVVLGLVVAMAGGVFFAVSQHPPTLDAPPADARVVAPGEAFASEPVWVEWSGEWYEASVISVSGEGRTIRVHYEGWSSSYDEDVTLDRVRTRR
jgi:hypothetical protein